VTPSGQLSPELDVILMDARYPLLSQNEDGSVVAMLHSVIATIEVKLALVKKEILKIRKSGKAVSDLQRETFPQVGTWGGVMQFAVAYRSGIMLATVEKHYFDGWSEDDPCGDINILRVHQRDQDGDEGPLGAHVWLEGGDLPSISTTLAPLSDFYYELVQGSFYTLAHRGFEFTHVGQHMMEYMAWGTFPCTNRGA